MPRRKDLSNDYREAIDAHQSSKSYMTIFKQFGVHDHANLHSSRRPCKFVRGSDRAMLKEIGKNTRPTFTALNIHLQPLWSFATACLRVIVFCLPFGVVSEICGTVGAVGCS